MFNGVDSWNLKKELMERRGGGGGGGGGWWLSHWCQTPSRMLSLRRRLVAGRFESCSDGERIISTVGGWPPSLQQKPPSLVQNEVKGQLELIISSHCYFLFSFFFFLLICSSFWPSSFHSIPTAGITEHRPVSPGSIARQPRLHPPAFRPPSPARPRLHRPAVPAPSPGGSGSIARPTRASSTGARGFIGRRLGLHRPVNRRDRPVG